MTKPMALLHAGLVTRAVPPAYRPPAPPPTPPLPAATVTPLHPTLPRSIALRPTRIEVEPAAAPELKRPEATATPLQPVANAKRRATTLRLDSRLYARLRVAREELDRSGQSILVEALDDWLRKYQVGH